MKTVVISSGLFLLLVILRLFFYFLTPDNLLPVGTITFESTLRSDPKISGSSQRITAFKDGKRIFITTSRFPRFHYGQRLEITGEVEPVLLEDGSKLYTMDYPQINVINEYTNPVLGMAFLFRERISSVFERYVMYPYSGLLVGIVFGVREGMPETLTEALIRTGVVHITAASGMNVTLVGGAMFLIFASFLQRKQAILISLFGIWFYAAIAGFDPSITRASLMASVAFSAALFGRQNAGWYALFLTGCFMCILQPYIILDVGFQLSFASTFGILILVPLFKRRNDPDSDQSLWFLRDDFQTTVAAQLFTIPILLTQFGTVSPFSIVVNLMILWTIPFLMILGGVASVLSLVFAPLSMPFLYLSIPLLWYIETVVLTANMYLPMLTFEEFPIAFSISYYSLLAFVCVILYQKQAHEKI